jgi:hypothetical protein
MDPRIFCIDATKALKAQNYGWLNAIHYLAPTDLAGVGNVCPHASAGCAALCLGWFAGHAAIGRTNIVRKARIERTRAFMHDRAAYLLLMVQRIDLLKARARRERMKLCVRLNGASDIGWEGIRFTIRRDKRGRAVECKLGSLAGGRTFFEHYRDVVFVDYTKDVRRALRHAEGERPPNYHLTFSRSESNESDCRRVLLAGGNVAVVFAEDPACPAKPLSYTFCEGDKLALTRVVLDGDLHDLRHLDPVGGVVIGLSPKGRAARKDTTGFVVRKSHTNGKDD